MTFLRQRVVVFLGVIAILLSLACETTQLIDPETGEPVWASVMPQTDVLRAIDASLQLQIVDRVGQPVTVTGITWRLLDEGIVRVEQTGRVTAVAPGTARIVVESSSQSDTVTIRVQQDVSTITLSPPFPSVVTGTTQQLSTTLRDPNGFAITDNRPVTWTSSASTIASVSGSGLVTAHGPGAATIAASSDKRSGNTTVTVTAAPPPPVVPVATVAVTPATASVAVGQTTPLTATLRDANGATLSGRAVSWSTSSGGIATVSTNGLVTAVAPGTATITATSEGKSGQSTITVPSPVVAVASVSMSPTTLSLTTGATGQLTATPRDAAGVALTGRVITWTTTAAGVATVSASGLVTAVAPGTATIRATSEGQSGTAAVTVTAPPTVPVATVTVSPATLSLTGVGATGPLTATLRSATGAILTGRVVTWTTTAAGVATVSPAGLVTAVGAGSATVRATSEGQSGTAAVTVTAVTTPPPPGPGVPVYDAANTSHVLHVFEDWSTYATIGEIGTTNRVDGGAPWQNAGASAKTLTTTNVDPWFGRKAVTINFQDSPAPGQAHGRGFVLEQHSARAPRFLRESAVQASVVIEWAVRQQGPAIYAGKIVDFQPQGSPNLGRFNFQNNHDRLGSRDNPSCSTDPLCNSYYLNGAPRFAGLPYSPSLFGDQFARSYDNGDRIVHWNQNRNWAAGATGLTGTFDYGEYLDAQGRFVNHFTDNVWRRYVLRLTLNQPGQAPGHGRVEQWMQRADGPVIKLMDYHGDVGAFDAGRIHTGESTGRWISDGTILYWYDLTGQQGFFNGGNTTTLGYFRMWSHPRQ
jgi:uncharacterized protein YjdB